jgi:diguanylate cyclase (GGDEF)-like protein
MGTIWFIVYYAVFSIASIILLIRWYRKIESHTPLKRQAGYFLLSIFLPFFLGMATETLPSILGISYFPKLAIVFMMIPVATLFFASRKFGLLLERKKETSLSMEIAQPQSTDRLRMFEMGAATYMVGAALSFLAGHFGMGGGINQELLLAASILSLGLITRLIPLLTKNHTIQNTLFLVLSILGSLFLMTKHAESGALTVWAAYIVFLLFTVVLEGDIHAFLLLWATLIIQAVLWIVRPNVYVVIDNVQYLRRMSIIVLSFYAVRYLTGEYSSKLKGYQRYSKSQETLEKISTSFISITSENVKEKVDELFKLSAEILEFDNAYLFEFDAAYENAMIRYMYVKDVERESTPFYPGTMFKTADFPEVKPLIAQNMPLMCEDVTDISLDAAGKQREFFLSRRINSFFAIPITLDNDEVNGFFVIEYHERSDKRLTEGRLHFLKIITNILGDARKKNLYEERLYHSAYFDQTTKLANRNMLIKRLDQSLLNRKESEKLAVLAIELENLRMINDTFGHSIGNQVVMKSAAMLKELLGECCDISRTGEARFVLVLSHAESKAQIESCAERILAAFTNPVSTDTGVEALFVALRIGIAVYPDDGKDSDTLLKNADLASYEAINTDERVLFYNTQLESHIAETTLFTNRLFKSLQNKDFFLEFQPQISCDTGNAVGIEALLRWTSDGRQRVPPDRFIPILEQTGLIYDTGLWVLQEALQEHKRLIAKGFPALRISVNLSVVQFQGENFIPDFTNIIRESQVDPKYIELEITESLFSENPEDTIQKLHKLKDLGLSIAIDDFGKGYSSLNRLKLLPFDRLKIDKEIIDYIDVERKKAPLTEIIILLARTFRASVTAEGVETKEQAEFLKSLACDEIQGYYYSKPLSPEALEEFLKKECDRGALANCSLR